MQNAQHPGALFGHGSIPEVTWIGALLRRETVGGAPLLVATLLALFWANSTARSTQHDGPTGPAPLTRATA